MTADFIDRAATAEAVEKLALYDGDPRWARSQADIAESMRKRAVALIDAAPRAATEPPPVDADVETVVRYSSPFRNCQYMAAFRAPCPEVDPARPDSWCPFCQAHARLAALATQGET